MAVRSESLGVHVELADVLGVQPALIAAIASRGSGAGNRLRTDGFNKNGNQRYGVMQVRNVKTNRK